MEVQSDSDSWDPQPQIINNQKKTMFNKIVVNFDDNTINQNINHLCQKPIIQQELKDFQAEQFQFGDHDTKDEQQNQLFNKKPTMKEENQQPKQAMYDALQDDDNEAWLIKNMFKGKDQKRPLTCPNCFTQLCYNYSPFKSQDGQKGYQTSHPSNIQICSNKIIRNRNSPQILNNKSVKESLKNADQNSQNKILQNIGQMLKQRYEDINVKIICKCNQCDLQLGYFDVNRQAYAIFNVI